MQLNNPYKQYKKTQVDTADQGKLVVMLYDGAIRFINNAMSATKSKQIEDVHNNIVKAQDIVIELATSLDMEVGDISEKLFGIYMYINKRLLEANMKKEIEPLEEVRNYLQELRGAWSHAAKNVSTESLSEKNSTGGVNIAT